MIVFIEGTVFPLILPENPPAEQINGLQHKIFLGDIMMNGQCEHPSHNKPERLFSID